MGAGKSAVGRELASRLGYAFVDLDQHIELQENRKISKIFETDGEERFRELERNYLNRLLADSPQVIALGGGTLQNEALKNDVLNNGILVFIDTPLDEIKKRLRRSRHRPLLYKSDGKRMQGKELDDYIDILYSKRKPVYETAHIRFIPQPGTAGDQANRIIQLLNKKC